MALAMIEYKGSQEVQKCDIIKGLKKKALGRKTVNMG